MEAEEKLDTGNVLRHALRAHASNMVRPLRFSTYPSCMPYPFVSKCWWRQHMS